MSKSDNTKPPPPASGIEPEIDLEQEVFENLNIGGKLTKTFINSKTTLLLMIAAIIFGLLALIVTPREENPQISVPAVNIIIPFPGASPHEVENLVINPLERLIWDIKGIEHVYSIAYPDFGVVTAQFHVGEDQEQSIFKVFETVHSNMEQAPAGALDPLIKPVDINDVPIVGFTLFSDQRSAFELRETAQQMLSALHEVPGTSLTEIIGGDDRTITVEIDPVKAAAFGVNPQGIARAISSANTQLPSDRLETGGERLLIRSGKFLQNAQDVGAVVVQTDSGQPIYLRDLAEIMDGPGDLDNFSRLSFGNASTEEFHGILPSNLNAGHAGLAGRSFNAVTIAIAKKKGTNSVSIAEALLERMEELAPTVLDGSMGYVITKNDGETANHAVNELLRHLFSAIIIVIGLLVIFLGWRDSAVVAVAIPITMLVTLGVGMMAGQTINRITLFALILSLGLLVDDAIVVVENIHRHMLMRKGGNLLKTCIIAVNEIANPTIYATLVVVVSMVPMAFVTGMMGPYMGPIPFNVPVAMLVSMLVAFKITPYLAVRWLKQDHKEPAKNDKPGEANYSSQQDAEIASGANPRLLKLFRGILTPLMHNRARRNLLFAVLAVLLLASFTLPVFKLVKFRMLPKANKNTYLVLVDLPAGSSMNLTDRLVREMEGRLLADSHTRNLITTVGTGSVIDFNGLLRGNSFRSEPHQADIRVNISPKETRSEESESIVLRMRKELKPMADKYGAVIKLVEDPPGPPVRSTMLAEIYGPYGATQRSQVRKVSQWFAETDSVVDIDDSVSTVAKELKLVVDEEKAVRAGLTPADVATALYAAIAGYEVTQLHSPSAKAQVPVLLRFPAANRSSVNDLSEITLPSPHGPVPLSTLVQQVPGEAERRIYHKDLRQVSYVYGEMAHRSSVYANIDLIKRSAVEPPPAGFEVKWQGEWDLTLKVFRDLGIAMGVAMLLIYLILVGRFKSFVDPLILMGAVPLMMLGVLPGFAIVGFSNVYFSATGMIGVIALAGIVTRNSIILIEFIQDAMDQGMGLKEAVIYAGAVRSRPIFLTAVTAMAGMVVMVTDPVWSGLSWALIFGIIASTPLSLIIVPLIYFAVKERGDKKAV